MILTLLWFRWSGCQPRLPAWRRPGAAESSAPLRSVTAQPAPNLVSREPPTRILRPRVGPYESGTHRTLGWIRARAVGRSSRPNPSA